MALPMESSGLFSDMVVSMIDVGEETGALPDMLIRISDIYGDYIDNTVSKVTTYNNLMLSASVIIVAILTMVGK